MVAFAESNESGEDVITRRIAVIEGLISKPMGK
jgi:hypothetical protein